MVHRYLFTHKILQYANSYHDLVPVLFTTLCLGSLCRSPSSPKENLFPVFDSGLTLASWMIRFDLRALAAAIVA